MGTIRHSIVVPVFNEQESLARLFSELREISNKSKDEFEFILVNDGSQDQSGQILEELHRQDPRFKALHFSRNFGQQAALAAGLAHASGHTVTTIDADLQDPPSVVLEMIETWRQGFEVVHGLRTKREGEGVFKRWSARFFYRILRRSADAPMASCEGDFRLLDRRAVDALRSFRERYPFVRGLVAWMGFRQASIPYDRPPRRTGSTHYPLGKMLRFSKEGLISFSTLPLRAMLTFGVALFLLGLAGLGALALWQLLSPTPPALLLWLLDVAVIFVALQFTFLGVLGTYLGRVLDEVRGRPVYIVSSATGFSGRHGSHDP